jgi:hypothetical protein
LYALAFLHEHVSTYGERPPLTPSPDEVRVRAYFLWQAAGWPPGDGVGFWLAAEWELRYGPTFEMVRVA